MWVWTSTRPGKSVPPLPSSSVTPSAAAPGVAIAAIRPSRTTTSCRPSSSAPCGASKTRTFRITTERAPFAGRVTSGVPWLQAHVASASRIDPRAEAFRIACR